MFAGQLVSSDILPISSSDTLESAEAVFLETNLSILPLVNEQKVMGWISGQQVFQASNLQAPASSLCLPRDPKMEVKADTHLFELVSLFAETNAKQLLVTEGNDLYKGLVLAADLGMNWQKQTFVKKPGGIVVLEMEWIQYSLAEIARIAESNDVKIIQVMIQNKSEESTVVRVALKLDRYELGGLMASFERYGYQIAYKYSGPNNTEDFDDRYKWLMKIIAE
jgi:acetoin utilization protein AcuB